MTGTALPPADAFRAGDRAPGPSGRLRSSSTRLVGRWSPAPRAHPRTAFHPVDAVAERSNMLAHGFAQHVIVFDEQNPHRTGCLANTYLAADANLNDESPRRSGCCQVGPARSNPQEADNFRACREVNHESLPTRTRLLSAFGRSVSAAGLASSRASPRSTGQAGQGPAARVPAERRADRAPAPLQLPPAATIVTAASQGRRSTPITAGAGPGERPGRARAAVNVLQFRPTGGPAGASTPTPCRAWKAK